MKWFLIFLALLVPVYLSAQEGDSLDWDIDTIFDEPVTASPPEGTVADTPGITGTAPGTTGTTTGTKATTATTTTTVKSQLKRRGYIFGVTYGFITGLSPGWYEVPWDSDWHKEDYYLDRAIKLQGSFSVDAQFTETFRAISTISYEVPGFNFTLKDFFFDYNFSDTVFFRGGKYNLSWGISPNYHLTDILARVPKTGFSGDSYIFRADMPIGIGGIQVLALTRADLMHGVKPEIEDFGFGGKYNLALRWADLDTGIYYKNNMPLRGFLSIKTTIDKTELYNEYMGVVDFDKSNKFSGALNFGFARDFFSDKLSLAGEIFYNAEDDVYWYKSETSFKKSEISPFIEGLNIALNLTYRPWEKGNPRLFIQALFAPEQNTAQLIPGFRLTPVPNLELYFAVPMALGSKDGYYYSNTVNKDNKGKPLPFGVTLMFTLKGTIQSGHYN